jgi:hypothetical protein
MYFKFFQNKPFSITGVKINIFGRLLFYCIAGNRKNTTFEKDLKIMGSGTFLYTVPQWIIFAAVISIVYGWIEAKQVFKLIGLGILFLLGILSVYLISQDYFAYSQYLSPEEVLSEQMEEPYLGGLPIEAKILPAFWIFVAGSVLSIPAFILEWKNKKGAKLMAIITGLIVLAGFFIIVGSIRG